MEFKEIDLKDILRIIIKRKILIAGVAAIVIILTFITLKFFVNKSYAVKTTIYYPDSSGISSIGAMGLLGGSGSDTKGTATASVLGPLMLQSPASVHDKLYLESRKFRIALIDSLDLFKVYKTKNQEAIINTLKSSTKVTITKDGLLTYTVKANKVATAVDIANESVNLLKESYKNNNASSARKRRIFIEGQLVKLSKDIEKADIKVKEMDEKYKIFDAQMYSSQKSQIYNRFESNLQDAEYRFEAAKKALFAKRDNFSKSFDISKGEPGLIPFSKDSTIETWKREYYENEYDLLVAKRSYSSLHPKVKSLLVKKEELKKALKKRVHENIIKMDNGNSSDQEELEITFIQTEADVLAAKKIYESVDKEYSKIPAYLSDYIALKRNLQIKVSTYTMLLNDLESAKLAEVKEAPDFEVLDEASATSYTVSPPVKMIMLMGVFMGIVTGLISAFIYEYLDRAVGS